MHENTEHISVSHKREKEDMVHVEIKEECDVEDFCRKNSLSKHFSIKHEGKNQDISYVHERKLDFTCSICGIAFGRKDSLNKHISKKHKGVKDVHEGKKQDDIVHVQIKEECDSEDLLDNHATSSELDPLSS